MGGIVPAKASARLSNKVYGIIGDNICGNYNHIWYNAYQLGFDLAMKIFNRSKLFLKEERYSLIDQIRRSSRSVCTNLAEVYCKRRYPAHFIAKISDADTENSETSVWLDFALKCNYLTESEHTAYMSVNEVI